MGNSARRYVNDFFLAPIDVKAVFLDDFAKN